MNQAVLHDGRKVDSYSEDWRHETEARYILRLPSLEERQAMLAGIEIKRGKPATDRLRETITALWAKERA